MPDPFILCAASDLRDNIPLECAGPDGRRLAVVRHQGAVRVFPADCPHEGAPLADGDIADGKITCCLHFWSWHLQDGRPADDETDLPLEIIPARVADGQVILE